MSKRQFRLPSPAVVISMVALALALGGTAVAATVGTHADANADTKLVKALAPKLSVKHAVTAANASAVNGHTVTRIFATVAPGASAIQVYGKHGLTLTFSCPTSVNDQIVANGPARANDNLVAQGDGDNGAFHSRTEDMGPSSNVVIGSGNYGTGLAEYGTSSGHVVSVTYGYDDAGSGISSNCSMWGVAVSN
jgi:hypothetical protein